MASNISCFCIGSSVGTRDGVGWLWGGFGPPPPPPPRWLTLLTVLGRWSRCWSCSLLLYGLFCKAICFVSCLVLFRSCVFQSFCIAITSLGEQRATCTFVRFVLVWFCRFLHYGEARGSTIKTASDSFLRYVVVFLFFFLS